MPVVLLGDGDQHRRDGVVVLLVAVHRLTQLVREVLQVADHAVDGLHEDLVGAAVLVGQLLGQRVATEGSRVDREVAEALRRLGGVFLGRGNRRVGDPPDLVDGDLDGRSGACQVRNHVLPLEPAQSRAPRAPGSTGAVPDGTTVGPDQPQRDWFWFSVDW